MTSNVLGVAFSIIFTEKVVIEFVSQNAKKNAKKISLFQHLMLRKKVLQGFKQISNQRTTMNWQVALSATKIK